MMRKHVGRGHPRRDGVRGGSEFRRCARRTAASFARVTGSRDRFRVQHGGRVGGAPLVSHYTQAGWLVSTGKNIFISRSRPNKSGKKYVFVKKKKSEIELCYCREISNIHTTARKKSYT